MSLEVFATILSAVLAFGIARLYFVEYRLYLIDSTRQRLFNIRAELFDKASNNVISFDSDAYKITRTTLNGMIQFTHELSLTRLLILRVIHGRSPYAKEKVSEYENKWSKAYSDLHSQAAQKAIAEVNRKMHVSIIFHLIDHSIILRILARILTFIAQISGRLHDVKNELTLGQKARDHWSYVDAEANHLGLIM